MLQRNTLSYSYTLGFLLLLVAMPVSGQDWPQWRGSQRDGQVAGFVAPTEWPTTLQKKWQAEIGEGHSSPVVVGNRVYQLSRQGSREVVSCFALDSGKRLWQDSYEVGYSLGVSTRVIVGKHKQGPRSTPVVGNGRLYTLGIGGMLTCYDTASGKVVWRKDAKGQFKNPAPEFGTSMSPLLDRGLLIVHLGGDGDGALTAYDAVTGAVKWQWKGDGPGYASPVVVEIAGTRQIVTQTQKHIVGIWPENGGLLWQIPFTTDYEQNSVTPVLHQDTLILSGLEKGILAIRPKYVNGQWTTEQVWKNDEFSLYMNSPILSSHLLYGMSHKNKGQFFCLDARNGRTLWKSAPRQGENAAMVMAGNVMFWLNNSSELIAVRVSDKGYEELKRWTVADSETWAHPAVVGNRVLIRDFKSLTLWSLN